MRLIRLGILLGGIGTLCAQTTQATNPVTVRVADVTGAFVPKADVSVLANVSGAVITSKTDQAGEVHFVLQPGSYEVAIISPGFLKLTEGFEVRPSSDNRVSVTLQVAPENCTACITPQEEIMPLISGAPLTALIELTLLQDGSVLQSRPISRGKSKSNR